MDQNLETKNQYFLKKEEKNQIRKEEQKSRMIKNSVRWVIVFLLAAVLIWFVYDYFKGAVDERKEVQNVLSAEEFYPAQNRDHIVLGQEHPAYNSNPPTGGWHYDAASQTGIYDQELPDERLVHNLEHSHIWIAYRPDLSADEIEKLADIAKSYGSKIIMTPRANNDAPIVLVAWERLLKMQAVDETVVRAFIDKYRGVAGPEKIPDAGFKDFRKTSQSTLQPSMQK